MAKTITVKAELSGLVRKVGKTGSESWSCDLTGQDLEAWERLKLFHRENVEVTITAAQDELDLKKPSENGGEARAKKKPTGRRARELAAEGADATGGHAHGETAPESPGLSGPIQAVRRFQIPSGTLDFAALSEPLTPRQRVRGVFGRTRAHGTRTKYVTDGCRCMPCRLANARYSTRNLDSRTPPMVVRSVNGRGNFAAGRLLVVNRKTGVAVARGSDREAAHALRDWINEAWKPTLWASAWTIAAVRRHVRSLQAAGVSEKQIARLGACGRTRLMEIVNGRSYNRNRPRHRRVRLETAQRILAIRSDQLGYRALVDASETWRLIEELRRYGLTKGAIARRLGSKAEQPSLQLDTTRIEKHHADEVAALHDELWRTDPVRMREACSWACLGLMEKRRSVA